ncbi:signal peptidase II [Candidatus Woesearchaeota archaeon]|nr:signal peptidase II [Candidatus Woesearchaeota archaeon]
MTSPRTYRMMNFIENNLALVLISIAIIIVERIVKFYITENLRMGESIPVMGSFLMITRTENLGGGFGVLAGQSIIFISAAILVLVLIVYFYNKIIYDRLLVFASAFILGGTVGNMMDRLFFGHVIDYIDFAVWPTFNLSDVSLVTGVVLLFIYMYQWQEQPEKERTYVHY